VLAIVRAFSARQRGQKLLVLGNYRPDHPYHRAVRAAGSEEVLFPGAIFEEATVGALRKFTRVYVHGHQVGGTNPSLVEALAAPCPVLAQDNRFNRWVAGPGATYFHDEAACALAFDRILAATPEELTAWRAASAARHAAAFTPERVLRAYENLLEIGYPDECCRGLFGHHSHLQPSRRAGRWLDALAAQTAPTDSFEIIVADDGSSDHTGERVAAWTARRLHDRPLFPPAERWRQRRPQRGHPGRDRADPAHYQRRHYCCTRPSGGDIWRCMRRIRMRRSPCWGA
jgi:hypothetical protein